MGLLLVKDLIIVDANSGIKAGEVRLRGVPFLQVILRCALNLEFVGRTFSLPKPTCLAVLLVDITP